MPLKQTNKANPNFNMSSLTDIIFLLLIFFMLTSTLVAPNALNLDLPSSNSQTVADEGTSVSITRNLEYYVGVDKVSFDELPTALSQQLEGKEDPTIILNAEKSVPIEHVVNVMNIAKEMKLKVILATNKLREE